MLWHLEHFLLLFPHWPCCPQGCLSHLFSVLSSLAASALAQWLFPLHKYFSQKSCHCCWWSEADPSRNHLALAVLDTEGSFWQLLTKNTPVTSLLPKPCHANPMQWERSKISGIYCQEGYLLHPFLSGWDNGWDGHNQQKFVFVIKCLIV